MKRNIIGSLSLAFLFSLLQTAHSQTTTPNTSATPVVPPTGKHSPSFEIQKHLGFQYKRINKALAAKTITIAQARTLRAQVTLSYKKLNQDYVQNQVQKLTPSQESQIFQLITNSARAIDAALGTSSSTSDPS